MAARNLVFASWNFALAQESSDGFHAFVIDRSLVLTIISKYYAASLTWLSSPNVYAIIIAWAITFTVVIFLILSLGFGPKGIAAGSLMAAFQGWMYGGFTPAGGLFATLTSFGTVGFLCPTAAVVGAIVATGVAFVIWAYGVGS